MLMIYSLIPDKHIRLCLCSAEGSVLESEQSYSSDTPPGEHSQFTLEELSGNTCVQFIKAHHANAKANAANTSVLPSWF